MRVSKFGPEALSVEWTPQEQGLITWTYSPTAATQSAVLATAGTLYTFKMHMPTPASVTNIVVVLTAGGSSLTAGQCFGALYQNGQLLAQTADQATAWATSGRKTMALTGGPISVAAGDVVAVLWFNGTTGPAIRGGPPDTTAANTMLTTANFRFGVADTGRTTTAPGTLGTVTGQSNVPGWIALS